ncbi:MAG TPA: type III-B CRISPR module RAMP protein Cmr1 [Clostridiales bacterium]|nr:type III-B CRISPR module RAMP protein Cmr1 [Clostridiales bacterium]
MENNEYKVGFETITPLAFGNAWQKNTPFIRASSLMGSLRFWFEIICYFSGITKNEDYITRKKNHKKTHGENVILKADLDQKTLHNRLIQKLNEPTPANKGVKELTNELLTEMKIPLPSRVFGCTGWQGLIKIKAVKYIEIFSQNQTNPSKNRNKGYSDHDSKNLNALFNGSFNVIFETDNDTANNILFPLLKFIEKYGFIGGAWNSGYGRVKVSFNEINKIKEKLDGFANYGEFANKPVKFDDLIETVNKKEELWKNKNGDKKIKIYICGKCHDKTEKSIFSILKKEKKDLKRKIENNEKCKKKYEEKCKELFGVIGKNAQGSKILPWVYKDNGKKAEWKYGFVSIVDVLNIG